MRTIDAALAAALAKRNGIFIARFKYSNYNGSVWSSYLYKTIYSYKFDVETLVAEIEGPELNANLPIKIKIERGFQIDGTDYYVDGPVFYLFSSTIYARNNKVSVVAHALPNLPSKGVSAWQSAKAILMGLLSNYDIDIEFLSRYDEPWKNWTFAPAASGTVDLSSLESLHGILKQRYFASIWPGRDGPLFLNYGLAATDSSAETPDKIIPLDDTTSVRNSHKLSARYLVWIDNLSSIRTLGSPDDPLHNLGYIETTVPDATIGTLDNPSIQYQEWEILPDLALENGDIIAPDYDEVDTHIISLKEEYNPKSSPGFRQWIIKPEYLESVSTTTTLSKTPRDSRNQSLDISKFDNLLSENDNTVQLAFDKLDDHDHASIYAPIAKGVTGGDAHDHNGGDGALVPIGGLIDGVDKTVWTPTVVGTTIAGAGTYSEQVGYYVRLYNVVYYALTLVWSAHTGTGNMQINGLPLASANIGLNFPLALAWANITLLGADSKIMAYVTPNSTVITLREIQGGNRSAIPMDTVGRLELSGFYFV